LLGIVVSKIDGESFGSYWRRWEGRSPLLVIIKESGHNTKPFDDSSDKGQYPIEDD
jgi:hypothetical protein